MNPTLQAQIQQMIQQGMTKNSQSNRFNVSNTNRHIHNNIDAPYTFQPILTYGGSITSSGGINFLPSSWTIVHTGSGLYTLTHNLKTLIYVVSAIPQGSLGVGITVTQFLNTVQFACFNTFSFLQTDTPFNFTLTVFNNSNPQIPIYAGSFISKTQAAPPF